MISVIVPVYNGERYVKDCIESIQKHLNNEDEIIVVDDGSSDRSLDICQPFSKDDTRIHLIHQQNSGVSAARNLGMQKAKGEWILFVDVDDLMLENVSDELQEIGSTVDFVAFGTNSEQTWEKRRIIGDEALLEILGGENSVGFKMNAVWAKAYRRKMLIENNIKFKTTLFHGEDLLFIFFVVTTVKEFYIINKMIYNYRPVMTSATHKYQKNSLLNEENFLYEIVGILGNNTNIFVKRRINYMAINGIWIACGQNICHKENKMKFLEKKKALYNMVNKEPYKTIINETSTKDISRNRRILISMLKNEKYGLIIAMFILRNKVLDLRKGETK